MNSIDSALLDLTEWACHKFQLLTGRTNVWLALQLTNLSIIVYFLWAGLYFWSSDVGIRTALVVFCGALIYGLTQTIFKVPIEAYESAAYRRVAKGVRNPRRVRDVLLRTSFLALSVMLFYPILFVYLNLRDHVVRGQVAILGYSLILLTTVVLYLLACDPLPPRVDEAREWVRGAVPARATAPEPGRRRIASRRSEARRRSRSALMLVCGCTVPH